MADFVSLWAGKWMGTYLVLHTMATSGEVYMCCLQAVPS